MKIKIAIFLLAVCWQTVEGDGNVNTSWSFFLGNLSNYLSGPSIQLEVKKYMVNDLKDWGNCSKTCAILPKTLTHITNILKLINDSYSKLNSISGIYVIGNLIMDLKHVHDYKETGLIEMLQNSRYNFTNETLNEVETEMLRIQGAAEQTGCNELYRNKQDHCIEAKANGPPDITKENFRDFLYILKKEDNKTFHNFICWANVELSEKQIKEVNLVLTLNLKQLDNPSGPCNGNRTIFSGNIVRISDLHLNNLKTCPSKNKSDDEIVQIMASDTIYIDEDINFTGRKLLLAIMAPTVVVVGDRKIWLDGLNQSSGNKFPRGLDNTQLIRNVSGFETDRHLMTFFYNHIKIMRDGIPYLYKEVFPTKILSDYFNKTIDSPHGAPGLPGQTGGSFFGLANVFENSSKLSIMSRGGKGGYGQHGAHGRPGKNGTIKENCAQINVLKEGKKYAEKYKKCKSKNPITISWKPEDSAGSFLARVMHKDATAALFYGELATNATDGGHGGAGGSGGNCGQIQIITLNRNDTFNIWTKKGTAGIPGFAGKKSNVRGYTPEQEVTIIPASNPFSRKGVFQSVIVDDASTRILRKEKLEYEAKDGIDGNNTQGQELPSPAIDINANLDSLITDYRRMLKKSLETYIPSDKILDHLMAVTKQSQIVGNCSTISVVNELLEYEDSFYKLHNKLNYTRIYSTLLKYTETKAERVQERDDKRALHYTYTAILSKLHAIKNHKEEKYIANLNNFLNMFVEKLKRYKEKKREIAIIEEGDRYHEEINKQIEDANNVISNSIMPKLEEIFAEIDRELEQLKREVDQKEQELLAQRKELEKKKEAMKKNLLARLFGNILKLIGSVVSIILPFGKAAGMVLNAAGTMVKTFGVDETAYEKPHIDQSYLKYEGVINTFEAASNQKRLIIKNIDEALNTFTGKIGEFDKEHGRITNVYTNIKDNIDVVKHSFTHIKTTYETAVKDLAGIKKSVSGYGDLTGELYQNCKNVFTNVKNTFTSASKSATSFFNTAENVLSNIMTKYKDVEKVVESAAGAVKGVLSFVNNAFQSVSGIFGKFAGFAVKGIDIIKNVGAIFVDMNEDREQMAEIDRALAENQKSLDAIHKYRKGIDEHMKPMMEGMKKSIREFPKMCEGKSEAQLMETAWKVDLFLDKIISIMTQMTKEFQVGESFKTTITSIKEAVSLMTNIFRKIQDYGNTKKLSNHMVRLNLAGSEIQINNPELRNITIRLSAAIEANLLLFDYRVWIKQIRLFVFPLPDTYLDTFKVPTAFESDDAHTLDGYTTNAIKAVERFRAQYIESNVYISKFDKLKHRAFFYNDTQMGPFFVWKNKNHRRAISRLFAGESVVFEALTLRSGMNALKFRRIDLVFRTNKKNQTLLDNILKNFMVRMKHIGNNYYNCDKITYVATVLSQTFKFSYQYINREPVDINLVYDKILHGDYMLSPYTTWYIKLINANPKSYKLLRDFRRDVDIELSGEGEYFEDKSEVCEDDLSEYYQTRDQFKRKKRKEYDKCPAHTMVKKGFLCCEFNSTFDPKDKEWCRAIVRKPETLDRVHNTSEDNYYYYYDRYFRKSALSADDIKTKFRATCGLHYGDQLCIEAFKNRQAYRPWFFYDDKAGGPFSRSYLYCSKGKCLARIEKALGPLKGLQYTNENAKYYFYAKHFNESYIQADDRTKFERCSPSDPDCAPAFENSSLLNFYWELLPEEFQIKDERLLLHNLFLNLIKSDERKPKPMMELIHSIFA